MIPSHMALPCPTASPYRDICTHFKLIILDVLTKYAWHILDFGPNLLGFLVSARSPHPAILMIFSRNLG